MPVLAQLTCASTPFVGPCSGRRKEESSFIPHSTLSPRYRLSYYASRLHDAKAMDAIPNEENSCYIFDRAYNNSGWLFTIYGVRTYFVVRGKKINNFWLAYRSHVRCHKIHGRTADHKQYPEKTRRVIYLNNESDRKFIFFINALDIRSLTVPELYRNRWQIVILQVIETASGD